MKKTIIFIGLFILIIVYCIYSAINQNGDFLNKLIYFNWIKKVSYRCSQGKSIYAVYQYKKVTITLNDKRKFLLNQTLSASGIRFENNDGSLIFRSKSNEAYLQEKEIITYENCVEKILSN